MVAGVKIPVIRWWFLILCDFRELNFVVLVYFIVFYTDKIIISQKKLIVK